MTDYKHWRNIADNQSLCFITTGLEVPAPLLAEPANAKMLLSALDFYRRKFGFLLHAFVIMPEHIHLLLQLLGTVELPKLIADFKRYTSKQLLQWCTDNHRTDLLAAFAERGAIDGEKHSVWERSFRSVPIWGAKAALTKIEYIHGNPVRRGLAVLPEDWPYSSATAYSGRESPFNVDLIVV